MTGRVWTLPLLALLMMGGSDTTARWIPNHPHPTEDRNKNYYYSTITDRPKHFDPAMSYNSGEWRFLEMIYEPPLEYHWLKRPYELIPLTAEEVPVPVYFDHDGREVPSTTAVDSIAKAVYTIKLKKGIFYAPHPCFARDVGGKFLYRDLTEEDLDGFLGVRSFEKTGTRELLAADYVYQIKRLCDPTLTDPCPIYESMSNYIDGMKEFGDALREQLKGIRAQRKEAGGRLFNRDMDEQENPIILDYDAHPFPGVNIIDNYTYQIILKRKYPQLRYWLSMYFFSPMPHEAVSFYRQGPMIMRNYVLDRHPVGTGPYYISKMDKDYEIVLDENPNFHGQKYPSEGEEGDREKGLLDDAGVDLPIIERLIYVREKEAIPRWQKFKQGYYDASPISSDVFDQVIEFNGGESDLSEEMRERGIHLTEAPSPSITYFGFNMRDPVVGGLEEKRCKLRQALSIAMNIEEYVQIFLNGRAVLAHGPIPPGIEGHVDGSQLNHNSYVYKWDEEEGAVVRRSIEEAKRLLAEAGYPDGRDSEGRPLEIRFASVTGSGNQDRMRWMKKQFDKINVHLEMKPTDFSRFQDKVRRANYQMISWGWNADYPDPENFFFLMYGPNSRVISKGENTANYQNSKFDALFTQMESMDDGPKRREIISKMNVILQHDAPWIFQFHRVDFTLGHGWMKNGKPNAMYRGALKYKRIDTEERSRRQLEWNVPNWRPLWWILFVGLLGTIPATVTIWRRAKAKGCAP